MKTKEVYIIILYLSCCHHQLMESCISSFKDLEAAILNDSENMYNIAKAYFPLKREINPVCVNSYYYIGLERDENCTYNTTDSNGMLSGCLEWRWCINTFYMAVSITNLRYLSFNILLNVTTEVKLKIPLICNENKYLLNEYFHRITVSLYHYARHKGNLGNEIEYIGYAEKLKIPKSESKECNNCSLELPWFKTLHKVSIILGLLSLPTFCTIFIICTYVELTNSEINHNKKNLYTVLSFLMVCFAASILMASLIFVAFIFKTPTSKEPCFYVPYLYLIVLILISFVILFKRAKTIQEIHRLTKLHHVIEFMSLGIFTMTMQMLSWHLVFVLYGFILNPLRAFLYSTTILIVVACSIILLALVLKVIFCTACADDTCDINGIFLMLSIPILLIFLCTYCLSILGISISSSNQKVDEITKSLVPKVILIMIAWFIYNVILNSDNRVKFWSLPQIIMDDTKLKEYILRLITHSNINSTAADSETS